MHGHLQGCHNLLTINPKEHTPNPKKTLYMYLMGIEGYNIPNLHMLTKMLKNPNIKDKVLIFGSTALIQEWALAWDTTVHVHVPTSDSATTSLTPFPTLTVSLASDVMRKSLTPTT